MDPPRTASRFWPRTRRIHEKARGRAHPKRSSWRRSGRGRAANPGRRADARRANDDTGRQARFELRRAVDRRGHTVTFEGFAFGSGGSGKRPHAVTAASGRAQPDRSGRQESAAQAATNDLHGTSSPLWDAVKQGPTKRLGLAPSDGACGEGVAVSRCDALGSQSRFPTHSYGVHTSDDWVPMQTASERTDHRSRPHGQGVRSLRARE
jgi:hypothetical protein